MNVGMNRTDSFRTVRQVLPYRFQVTLNGKVHITKLNGQVLIVSRGEIDHILKRDDLDVHRRKMYEAALDELNNHGPKCTCLDPVHPGDDPNCPVHGTKK